MRKITFIFLLAISNFYLTQSKAQLPFVGTKSFSFCEGNACSSEIRIFKNGLTIIVTYGFFGDENIEYNGKYKPILWVYEKGQRSYGYKIVKNVIYQVDINGKIQKDCFANKVCKSFLYYEDSNGQITY